MGQGVSLGAARQHNFSFSQLTVQSGERPVSGEFGNLGIDTGCLAYNNIGKNAGITDTGCLLLGCINKLGKCSGTTKKRRGGGGMPWR